MVQGAERFKKQKTASGNALFFVARKKAGKRCGTTFIFVMLFREKGVNEDMDMDDIMNLLGGTSWVKIVHELSCVSSTPKLSCKQGAGALQAFRAERSASDKDVWGPSGSFFEAHFVELLVTSWRDFGNIASLESGLGYH